jgi:putative endonuclease
MGPAWRAAAQDRRMSSDAPSHPERAPAPDDPRRLLGRRGEDLALAHLERLGYALLARNHRTRFGELDLIVFDGETIAFVEVKTRRLPGRAGSSLEAFSTAKTSQVRRMAAAWLAQVEDRPRAAELRFDAVAVTVDARGGLVRLDHLEAAF